MRYLKFVITTFGVALAAVACAPAPAFAVPELKGEEKVPFPFVATSGETLVKTAKFKLSCIQDAIKTGNGEFNTATTAKATVDFLKCKAQGFAADSLGDEKETILVPLTGELCFIKEVAPLEVGVFWTLPSGGVHIEIPALAELLSLTGSIIAKVEPINMKKELGFKFIVAEPNVEKCGGKTASLKVSINEAAPEAATMTSTEEVNFTRMVEFTG